MTTPMALKQWCVGIGLAIAMALTGCGGGGGGGVSGGLVTGTAPNPAFSGQVVKGPTAGATVRLYEVQANGIKTLISTAVSDASGNYLLPVAKLDDSKAYLIEAMGGQYIDEATGVLRELDSPLRALVRSSDAVASVVLSALTEAVVANIESSTAPTRWSPSFVTATAEIYSTALGLDSLWRATYVDLTKVVPGAGTVTSDSAKVSYYIGLFAHFQNETRATEPNAKLDKLSRAFADAMIGRFPDDQYRAKFFAAFIRHLKTVPSLEASQSRLLAALGLPADADPNKFDNAQSSGKSAVSAGIHSMVSLRLWVPYLSAGDVDAVFDARGALEGIRSAQADAEWTHVGMASVAEVAGDAEATVGRWNRGYVVRRGMTYDNTAGRFSSTGFLGEFLESMTYGMGTEAKQIPGCSTASLGLKAQTRSFQLGVSVLKINQSTSLVFHTSGGVTVAKLNLVLEDQAGVLHSVEKMLISAPQANGIPHPNIYADTLNTPTLGQGIAVRVLRAGVGGRKAVLRAGADFSGEGGIAAVLESAAPLSLCETPTFFPGNYDPLPSGPGYSYTSLIQHMILGVVAQAPDGTPSLGGFGSPVDVNGMEKAGNDLAGIGLFNPPFVWDNKAYAVPAPFAYFKSGNDVLQLPHTGTHIYDMTAATPYVVATNGVLVSAKRSIQSATLKAVFGVGPSGEVTNIAGSGTCELSIQQDGVANVQRGGLFLGQCSAGPLNIDDNTPKFLGAINGGSSPFAAIRYQAGINAFPVTHEGGAALLFKRRP